MITAIDFAILAIATMFAVAAAAGFSWMFLRAAFALMHPATARRIPPRARPTRRPWCGDRESAGLLTKSS